MILSKTVTIAKSTLRPYCLPKGLQLRHLSSGQVSESRPTRPPLNQTGQCLCGAVKFKINGKIVFNFLCHCRACVRARSMAPVHLLGVKGDIDILEGQDVVKTVSGLGTMIHVNCGECGTGIYQKPKGAKFITAFPTTFHIEAVSEGGSVPSSMLPEVLLPKAHINYENRLTNFYDSLPKYKTFPDAGPQMTNEGVIIEEP